MTATFAKRHCSYGGLLVATTLLVLTCAAWAWSQSATDGPIPAGVAIRAETPPEIDGRLDDECWAEAPGLAGFTRVGTHSPASQPTVVRLLFDERAFYIGFLCHEPNTDELAHTHSGEDAAVWFDDSVEIFIDPGHTHEHYFQFALNCKGATFDRHMENIGWTTDWSVGTAIGEDRWTAEVAIPFASMQSDPPRPNAIFAANFCRNRKTSNADAESHGEWSSWAPVKGQYHEPENFGHVIFTDSPREIGVQALADLTANPLCTDGAPMTRAVELELQSGVVRYTPHRARALGEVTGEQSEVTGMLAEVERLLAKDRWEDQALRERWAQQNASLHERLESLRERASGATDAVALQQIRVELESLREEADQLLWDARFELLFTGL